MKRHMILFYGTAFFFFSRVVICPAPPFKTTDEQRKFEEQQDKRSIIHESNMKTDTSPQFITIPADYKDIRDFDVAKTPPTIDFAIVQGLEPMYLPSRGENKERYGDPVWGGWGDVTKGPDGCFYFAEGNHMYIGSECYVIKYDPSSRKQSIVLDLHKLIGWGPNEYGDSKLHGDLDIGPDGDMWMLSFFGPYTTEEYQKKPTYRGSYVIRYNVFTGKAENLGIPLDGATWPYHAYDWERGLLFGASHVSGNVIAYDTKEHRMLYGGRPPYNILWYSRGVLLDRETGIIYSNDCKPGTGNTRADRYDGDQHFVSYKRHNNEFIIMKAMVPPHPVTGKRFPMRAHTKVKDDNGAFWCMDATGGMFKFYPAEDRTEPVGINWGKNGKYVSNMCFSPKKRYIYYVMDAATQGAPYGTPVVQYDTRSNRKKVIAFLNDFYLDKYGYSPGGTYGVELDAKGESLFFYVNGQFTTKERGSGYGRPAIYYVHIPESERIE